MRHGNGMSSLNFAWRRPNCRNAAPGSAQISISCVTDRPYASSRSPRPHSQDRAKSCTLRRTIMLASGVAYKATRNSFKGSSRPKLHLSMRISRCGRLLRVLPKVTSSRLSACCVQRCLCTLEDDPPPHSKLCDSYGSPYRPCTCNLRLFSGPQTSAGSDYGLIVGIDK